MTIPSYTFGLAAGAYSALVSSSTAAVNLGKALPIGRDLELDPNTGDLKLTGGDLTLVQDVAAIRQEAETRMRFFLGEWFLDVTAGIPYFQNILVKSPNLGAIKSILTDEVLATVGVQSLLTMDLNFDAGARVLAVKWSASTDVGELIESTLDFTQ